MNYLRRGTHLCKAEVRLFCSCSYPIQPYSDSPDFLSLPRHVSNLELHNQIQEAALQSHLVPLGSIQLTPHFIPVEGLRRSIQRAF